MQTHAPLGGTIYASTGIDEPVLIVEGAIVHSNTVVAIIEAEAIFYPVPAGHSGLVTKILFENGVTICAGDCLVQIIRPQEKQVTQQVDGT